ncbi:TetR/AcrR family transcriptional regulator [Brucella anthropi]|uniref:TetR/AcrR family transcriptional regulator n=1 Tax=Brucella anthropi TaxID=529 RepID=UPI0039861C6D
MGRKKVISEDLILDAAEAVVAEYGANRLSLNLVAERAGISKGGLTYSFPSREALLSGITARDFARYQKIMHDARGGNIDRDTTLFAQVQVMRAASPAIKARSFSIMAAMTQVGEGMDAYRTAYADYFNSIADPEDPKAVVLMLATEAMFMLSGSGVMQWSPDEWQRMLDNIEEVCLDRSAQKDPAR